MAGLPSTSSEHFFGKAVAGALTSFKPFSCPDPTSTENAKQQKWCRFRALGTVVVDCTTKKPISQARASPKIILPTFFADRDAQNRS